MILDKIVKINWNPKNKKYYINKNYFFTKFSDSFFVNITDLKKTSHTKIHIKCDICEKESFIKYYSYIRSINNCGYYACSRNCSKNKYETTNMKRYGVKNPSQSKEIRNNFEKTCLERFGFKFPSQNEIIKKVKKITSLEHFGVENPMQNNKIKEKTKRTNLKKYGVECVLKNEIIKEKIKKTNIDRYGTEHYNNRIKAKQTNLMKYGVECPSQNKEIAEKGLETMIKRYGEVWLKHVPTYNPIAISYLDIISEKLNLPIRHALNGGEKKFIKYWVDGYIEKYNICIEWNEKHHNSKIQKEKDYVKENFIVKNFNCNYIKINQENFLNDINNQINVIENQINIVISDAITKTTVI
jgi:hypothetical protein